MSSVASAPCNIARHTGTRGVVYAPRAADEHGASPQGHGWFLAEARKLKYDTLVETCMADASLKTCAAVLVERFCMQKGIDKATLEGHLRQLEHGDQFVELWHERGELDLTRLPRDTLRTLVCELPAWHEALRRDRRAQ